MIYLVYPGKEKSEKDPEFMRLSNHNMTFSKRDYYIQIITNHVNNVNTENEGGVSKNYKTSKIYMITYMYSFVMQSSSR